MNVRDITHMRCLEVISQGLCIPCQHCVCCLPNIAPGMPPKRKASRGVARATASLAKRRRQDVMAITNPATSPPPQEDAPSATAMLATIMERLHTHHGCGEQSHTSHGAGAAGGGVLRVTIAAVMTQPSKQTQLENRQCCSIVWCRQHDSVDSIHSNKYHFHLHLQSGPYRFTFDRQNKIPNMAALISIKSCHLTVKMTLSPLASSHKMDKGGLSWCQTSRKMCCPLWRSRPWFPGLFRKIVCPAGGNDVAWGDFRQDYSQPSWSLLVYLSVSLNRE